MTKSPEKIYKYVKFDRWHDLRDGFIRFTPPAELNDPFEMAPYYSEWMSDELFEKEIVEPARKLTINKIADMIASQQWQALPPLERLKTSQVSLQNILRAQAQRNPQQFKQIYIDTLRSNRHGLDHLAQNIAQVANETFGILSLTTKYDNRPMWAHYTDNYSGLVIEFDAKHEFFTKIDRRSDFSGLRQITYSTDRPKAKHFLDEDAPYNVLYFVKSYDWGYEQEYRLVKLLSDRNKIFTTSEGVVCHLFKLPPECVTGIIFGLRMSQANRNIITAFLKNDSRYKHVVVYESKQGEQTFELNKKIL